MGKTIRSLSCICGAAFFILLLMLSGCGPKAKRQIQYSLRYKKEATKDKVFAQVVQGLSVFTGGVDNKTDVKGKSYVRSLPFPPRDRKYDRPTRYYMECFIHKHQKGNWYVPDFVLRAQQFSDRKWEEMDPPDTYSEFLEFQMKQRIVSFVEGAYHRFLKGNQFLGFFVLKEDVPVYADPDKQETLFETRKYDFGDLQLNNNRPIAIYRNGLLKIRYHKNNTRRIGWISDDAVSIFKFNLEGEGNPGALLKMYRTALEKAAFRNIFLHKGGQKGWPERILRAIANGNVLVGMTQEQVLGAAGPPADIKSDIEDDGTKKSVFIYKEFGTVYAKIHFVNGKVVK